MMRTATVLFVLCGSAIAVRGEIQNFSLTVLRGEGRFNDMRLRTSEDLVVQALDESGKPVVGARVTFTAPAMGAGGAFRDGQRSATADTDREGKAAASGFRPNHVEGRFPIRVTATFESKSASALIWQSNTLASGAKGGGSKKVLILLGLAGGAVTGVVIAASGGNTAAPTAVPAAVVVPPTSLSVGGVTVGPPR